MESGGFGHGFVDSRIDPTQFDGDHVVNCNLDDNDVVSNEAGEKGDEIGEAEAYTHKLLTAAMTVADSMSTLLLMIKDAPEQIRQHDCFKLGIEKSRHIVGLIPPSVPDVLCVSAMDSRCNRREWSGCLEKMIDVFEKRDEFNYTNEYPSFSLGFTQNPIFNQEVLKISSNPYIIYILNTV